MSDDGEQSLHRRPPGVDDATVEAVGRLSEAFEAIEVVRGHLYAAHRMTGTADFTLGDAVELLRGAGHPELADRIDRDLVGRNLIPGHWTFQIMEAFDDGYYADFRAIEQEVRDTLMAGRRHVHEAELKAERRTPGRTGHAAAPGQGE